MNKTKIETMREDRHPSTPRIRKRHMIYLALFLGTILTVSSVAINTVYASPVVGFNAGRIIDDGVFTNSFSMNVSQIQAFLNSKVAACDTSGTQLASEYGSNLTHAQYAASKGWPAPPYICLKSYSENSISAAQIIYNISQQYQINPQVLIVLLQKEQGLVTDTWPLSTQYRGATGYGCPDTAPCDTTYYGFTNQVTWSAKMFRAVLDNSPTWYSPYVLGNNTIQWSPNSACGGSTVNIQNRATQALYDYTPYQPNQAALNAGYGTGDACSAYGNRNFYLYFTDWFGSTQFPQPIGASLYYQQSSGAIYLVSNSTKYYIPSWQVMTNYKLDIFPTMPVSDNVLSSLTDGGSLSNLLWDTGGVYLVNDGARYHVSSDMCTAWGLSCFDSTKLTALSSVFQTQYLKQGSSLTNVAYINGILYKMSDGSKQPIANPKTLSDLGLNTTPVFVPTAVNAQQPLGVLLLTTPGVLQFSSTSPLYYFDGSAYYLVQDMNSYYDWSLNRVANLSVPESSYSKTLPSSTPLIPWVLSNGKKYIIDQARKVAIPDALTTLWSDKQFVSQPDSLLNNLSSDTLSTTIWTNPYVYYLDASKKHHVTRPEDFASLSTAPSGVSALRSDKITTISQGTDYIADGRLVALDDGSGKIYVVNNHKLTYIPSPGVFNAYGFDWGSIQSYSSTILSDYPVDTTALGNGASSDNTFFITTSTGLYQLPGALASDFGILPTSFNSINKSIIKKSVPTLTRYLYNIDDGAIYYASGEAIHHVMTYSAFRAYGGSTQSLTAVDSNTIRLFTISQPLY